MRLYLSSYRMGDRFEDLVAALPAGARVAVISNATDFIPTAQRIAYASLIFDPVLEFRSKGLDARELDLRAHFGAPETLEAALADVRLVWANGGNTFLLRRAMQLSGFDQLVQRRFAAGDITYGGWSAGAVVAGPSLVGLQLMDDPEQLADGYPAPPVWEGLALTDTTIVPHFQSEHPEADAAQAAVDWLTAHSLPHRPLRDGEVWIE